MLQSSLVPSSICLMKKVHQCSEIRHPCDLKISQSHSVFGWASPTDGKYQATLKDCHLKKPKPTENPNKSNPFLFPKISWSAWSLLAYACVASSTTSPQVIGTWSPLRSQSSMSPCTVQTLWRKSGLSWCPGRLCSKPHVFKRSPWPLFSPLLGLGQGFNSPWSMDPSPGCSASNKCSSLLQLQLLTNGI